MRVHIKALSWAYGRVVEFKLSNNNKTLTITEACDLYFSKDFNKQEFAELIDELKELHKDMK